jgi:UDP-glucose 4-epimerase
MTGIALRYFNACGAAGPLGEDHTPESHLIPTVLKAALGQRADVKIFGTDFPTPDGTCIRDYIHVKDLAQAHLLALRHGKAGAYNLGTGRGYSVREVIDTARRITGRTIPAVEQNRRSGDPAELVASADKARRELGWIPQYSDLETIISDAWQWHRQHSDGYAVERSALCAC